MKKRLVSLALSLILLLTTVFTGAFSLVSVAGADEPAGDLSAALEGYTRITVADIVNSSGYRIIDQDEDGDDSLLTAQSWTILDYAGSFGGKTYLDVDMLFNNAADRQNTLSWQGSERYKEAFYLNVVGGQFSLDYYDASSKITNLGTTTAAFGFSATSYVNVKLLTNVRKSSASADTETVDWQCWVNDMFLGSGSIEQSAHARHVYTRLGSDATKPLIMRVPKVLEEEFAGYSRVSISDFQDGGGGTMSIAATPAGTALTGVGVTQRYYRSKAVENETSYSLDKTYFDFDINLASSTTAPMIALYERVNWYSYLKIAFNNASHQLILSYVDDNGSTVTALGTYDLRAFGRTATDEFFNIKVRADFSANSANAATRDAVIQLWINDRFATETALTGKNMRNGVWFRPGGETTYVREQKNMAEELDGYRRVDMMDYSKSVNSSGVISLVSGECITSYITDYDKTYLDVDLSFGAANQNFQYQAYAKYLACLNLSFTDANNFRLLAYTDYAKNGTGYYSTLTTVTAADYGIAIGSYFNIKLRTDVTPSGSSDSVHVQLWINDQFAYEGTTTFTYGASAHTKTAIWSTGNISVRSAIDADTQLAGYTRAVADDFDTIGASVAEGGTLYASALAGEYQKGDSLDRTYFDVDIKTPNGMNPFAVWPSKDFDGTFYGGGSSTQLRFGLSGTTLQVTKVLGGASKGTVTLGDISAAPYNYSASEFFNLKIKTTLYGTNTLGLAVFVNNAFLKNIFVTEYSAELVAAMTCAGLRGANVNSATYARTPLNNARLRDLAYDLSDGAYLLKGWSSFRVNGVLMSAGETISAPGDYVVERLLNGEAVSSQLVSLYKLGDADLDGSAFVTGNPVWKDSQTAEGIAKFGAVTRASALAADLNNDGAVDDADVALYKTVRSNVSKVDGVVGVNYGDSVSFDYIGGKNVMPIGGFYGPADTATISHETYQLIRDSGINLITYSPMKWIGDNERDVLRGLALAEEYGIGVYLSDDAINGLTVDEDGNVTAQSSLSSASDLANAMAQYGVYGSLLGIHVIDEPKPSTGGDWSNTYYKRYKYYKDPMEGLEAYANLTGYVNMQGAGAFERGEYSDYLAEIEPTVEYLSFDSYLYLELNETLKKYRLNGYLETLDTMQQASVESGKPFWSYVSAGCDFRDDGDNSETAHYMTEADVLWNVNTSLAFGAKGITYFPMMQPAYFANEGEGYDYNRNGIIGADGNANRYYPMVQKANTQIAAVDDVLMNADSKGVITVGTAASDVSAAASQRSYTFGSILSKAGGKYTDKLYNVTASGAAGAMVGAFGYHSSEAYYVVNYDRTESATQSITLTFNTNYDVTVIQNGVKTTYDSQDACTVTLDSGEGVLIVLGDYGDVVIDVDASTYTLSAAGTVNGVATAAGTVLSECGVYTVNYYDGTYHTVVIFKLGDINDDSSINLLDLVRLKKYDGGSATLSKAAVYSAQALSSGDAASRLAALRQLLLA